MFVGKFWLLFNKIINMCQKNIPSLIPLEVEYSSEQIHKANKIFSIPIFWSC